MSSTIITSRPSIDASRSLRILTTPEESVAEPYEATAMKSSSTRDRDVPHQVAEEEHGALEHADEQQRAALIVAGYLLRRVRRRAVCNCSAVTRTSPRPGEHARTLARAAVFPSPWLRPRRQRRRREPERARRLISAAMLAADVQLGVAAALGRVRGSPRDVPRPAGRKRFPRSARRELGSRQVVRVARGSSRGAPRDRDRAAGALHAGPRTLDQLPPPRAAACDVRSTFLSAAAGWISSSAAADRGGRGPGRNARRRCSRRRARPGRGPVHQAPVSGAAHTQQRAHEARPSPARACQAARACPADAASR